MTKTIFSTDITALAKKVIEQGKQKNLQLATAESCTGGLIAGCLTDIPGASEIFDRGFITYSNDAKMAQVAVERKTLADFGAVSAETAIEMAVGALRASHADIAIAVTGIAGPDGGSEDKPVGLVYIALANNQNRGNPVVIKNNFTGDRHDVRLATVDAALKALNDEISKL